MTTSLTNIYLHGRLGKIYGKEWRLAVNSPAEAIRAIDVNVKGRLRQQLMEEGTKKYYKIYLGNKENALEKGELINPSGKTDIHIVPVAKGRKSGGAKILAAVAMVAIAFATGGLGAGGWLMNGAQLSGWGVVYMSTTASLLLGGITQLLTPVPNFNQNSDDNSRGSTFFQGNSSLTSQGATLGLVYGRMMVTPMPVSVAFDNYDQSAPVVGDLAAYDSRYLEGGLLDQYVTEPP